MIVLKADQAARDWKSKQDEYAEMRRRKDEEREAKEHMLVSDFFFFFLDQNSFVAHKVSMPHDCFTLLF